ncbi:MAG: CoA-binding protein [Chloroflexota bacterium]
MDQAAIDSINTIFDPRTVAVIGASDVYEKWGFQVFSAARESSAGTARKVYPVNTGASEVHGEKCYSSVLDIPGPVDLVLVTIPASLVPEVLDECGRKGVRGAVIITGDFAESGPEGAARQAEMLAVARRYGIRIVGPNIMGHISTGSGLVTTPFIHDIVKGKIGFASQSGNIGVQVLQYGYNDAIGFSKFVGTGNEADLTLEDFVEYFAQDRETSTIALYIEGLKNGRRLFNLARQITPRKPIVVIKAGRSEAGSRAARSHSSALAGSDNIYDAAFKQTGVIRAGTVLDLIYTCSALCREPLPRGNRVGIIVIGGGIGVLATDECLRLGLDVPPLSPETVSRINKVLPSFWSHGNPVDIVAESSATTECILALLDDNNIDAIMCVSTPGLRQILTKRLNHVPPAMRDTVVARLNRTIDEAILNIDHVIARMDEVRKPVIFCKTNPVEEKLNPRVFARLNEKGFTVFRTPEHGAGVLARLYWYSQYLRRQQ